MKSIHPPTGKRLICKNWQIEAAYRMIQHNLDPDVAEIPEELIVYGRFLRRGGIDINPFRSSHDVEPPAFVDWRQ